MGILKWLGVGAKKVESADPVFTEKSLIERQATFQSGKETYDVTVKYLDGNPPKVSVWRKFHDVGISGFVLWEVSVEDCRDFARKLTQLLDDIEKADRKDLPDGNTGDQK